MTIPVYLPQIVWNGYTATFAYPLDDPRAWVEPRGLLLRQRFISGIESTWDDGLYDYFLQCTTRWLEPAAGLSLGPAATFFNPANGIKDMLLWFWKGNEAEFYPDATSGTHQTIWLEKPLDASAITLESDLTRKITWTFRSDAEFTGY
jgi:hypothetical protein